MRDAIVETGRIAYAEGLMPGSNGNISVRLADGNVLISPSGLCKGRMTPGNLMIVDMAGRVVQPADDPALKVSSETPMHLEAYRQRPDVRAVVHAHPSHAVALSVADIPLRPEVLPETLIVFGQVPTSDFGMPTTDDDARIIRELVVKHDAIILRNHGSLTVGKHLDDALIFLERVEHAAQVQILAQSLGKVTPMPDAMLPQMWAIHRVVRGG